MLTAPRDVTRREAFILLPLAVLSILLGIWPAIILDTIEASVLILVKK
jgi:NADH:ubiquinone oxidoreductase subunit 4 (subunit M)